MRRWLVSCVVVSGCDLGDDEMTSFGERAFLSESVEGHTLVAGTRVSMRFDASGGMSVSAGCNSIGSDSYELSGGTLVTGELFSTEIGCDTPLHEQDEWLQSFLQATPSYTLEEPRLTLSGDGVTLVMLDREVADPDRTLQGRTWAVNGLIDGGSVGFGPSPQPATLEFGDDGALTITTSCAPGSATYEVGTSSITLSGVTIDDVACPDDENAVRIDEHMREVLVDASQMELMRGDIGLSLTTD